MKEGVESLGRIRLQGIALVAVAFVAGVLLGGAFERVRTAKSEPDLHPPRDEMFGRGFPMHEGQLPPMFDRLGLSAEQEARIHDIFDKSRPKTDAVLDEMLPRLRAVTDSARDEIRAVLTDAQAEQLDSIMQSFHERRLRRGERRPRFRKP